MGVNHIIDAYDEMSSSKVVQVLKSLRQMEIIVILAVFMENLKVENSLVEDVYDRC